MTTATQQRAKIDVPALQASVHKYRVMVGDQIMGQFSNAFLAKETAREYRAVVLIFEGSEWIELREKK